MIKILQERNFPVGKLKPLASARSAGKTLKFRGEDVTIEEARDEAFEGVDIVLGAAENDVFHFAAAPQLLGARLAQHPADGVGYIAFSAAVGAHHSGDAFADGNARAVWKGFKALYFKRLQKHGKTPYLRV